MNLSKLLYTFIWLTIASGIALILLMTYWLVYPYEPIVFHGLAQVETKVVKPYGDFIYYIDYCKNMELPATLTKEYIDGVVYATPSIIVNNPTGCGVRGGLTIVPNLPDGIYRMRYSYIYKVNPIREVTVVTESEPFEIKR